MVFENASAGRNTGYRSVVNRTSGFVAASTVYDVVSGIQNATELIDAVHTRVCTGIKKRP